jgi:hypothetical protein
VKRIRDGWLVGKPSADATTELLQSIRTGSPADTSELTVKLLNEGVAPQSIFEGLFDGAGELLMQAPGILSLHATTFTNAMRYVWQHLQSDCKALGLISPPNGCGGGGRYFPSMVVVVLGEPGVPVICWALTVTAASRNNREAVVNLGRSRSLGSSFGAFMWIAVSMVSITSQKPWFSLHPSMVAKTRAIHGRICCRNHLKSTRLGRY